MKSNKMKMLSKDSLLSLKGGGEDPVYCCIYFADNDQLASHGWSGTNSCDYIPLPAGMYAEQCDPPE